MPAPSAGGHAVQVIVDPWDPGYGSAGEDALGESDAPVDLAVERPLAEWAAVPVPDAAARAEAARSPVVFVDGVRRVDARVWVGGDGDEVPGEPGLCASWAAGAVRCDGEARIVAVEVGRGLFSAAQAATDLVTPHGTYRRRAASGPSPEELSLALQQAMTVSEVAVAEQARACAGGALLVVDGPLRGGQHHSEAVGLVKTHHRHYLPAEQRPLLTRLQPGERTPVLCLGGMFVRHTWYLRLPGPPGGPFAGIVRCECSADLAPPAAIALAARTAALLPRYASAAHKDTRAPQNLYPIAGLERELRRRLGDPRLLYRALRTAAA